MLILITSIFYAFFYFCFGSLLRLIITSLLTLLLMFESRESKSMFSSLLFLFNGLVFYIILFNYGSSGSLSELDVDGDTMMSSCIFAIIGSIAFIVFLKYIFSALTKFFSRVYDAITGKESSRRQKKIKKQDINNDEIKNYYVCHNDYINWLSNYMVFNPAIKSGIYDYGDDYKVSTDDNNLKNLSRFVTSIFIYCEENTIQINDDSTKKFVLFSYANNIYEIGVFKLDGGYIYCKKLESVSGKYNIINFENVLGGK